MTNIVSTLPHSCPNCGAAMTTPGPLEAEIGRLRRLIRCEQIEPPADVTDDQTTELAVDLAEAKVEIERLRVELADLLDEAFRQVAFHEKSGSREGWWDTMALTHAMDCGDRLVESGLWERHPDGYGRRWWYRPIVAEAAGGN